MPVHRPLASVSQLVDKGHTVVFKPDGAYIEESPGKRHWLQRQGGAYVLEGWVDSQSFPIGQPVSA
eukprot:1273776-Amphidinium_carterae.1